MPVSSEVKGQGHQAAQLVLSVFTATGAVYVCEIAQRYNESAGCKPNASLTISNDIGL